MAATTHGTVLTETHRLAQARVGAEMVAVTVAVTRELLDPTNLDATTGGWMRAMITAITAQRARSVRIAAGYTAAFRLAETGSDFTPVAAGPADLTALITSLRVTGPVSIQAAARRGVALPDAAALAVPKVAGAAMRHALNGGRDTILGTVAADPKAIGWARAASGRACAFCAMLASRGPVYSGEDTASFHPHDHCHCQPEPTFDRDAPWPAGSDDYRDLWDTVTHGLPTAEGRTAFRAAIEAQG